MTIEQSILDAVKGNNVKAIEEALLNAVEDDNMELTQFLLEKTSVDINKLYSEKRIFPFLRAVEMHHFKIAELLAHHRADMYISREEDNYSVLKAAVVLEDTEAVLFLVETLKFDPTKLNDPGPSALSLAKTRGQVAIVKIFQNYINKMEVGLFKDFTKKTLKVHRSINKELNYIFDRIDNEEGDSKEKIKSIVKDAVHQCNKDEIPVLYNMRRGDLEIIKKLLELGANPLIPFKTNSSVIEIGNMLGRTALEHARHEVISGSVIAVLKKAENERRALNLKEDLNLIQFFDNIKFVKEAGHVMGLSSRIKLKRKSSEGIEEYYSVKTENNTWYPSILTFSNIIHDYDKGPVFENFLKIGRALKIAQESLDLDVGAGSKIFYNEYKNGNIVIMPIQLDSRKHGITLTFCENRVIVCNRGSGMLNSSITIFPMSEKAKITPEFITSLRISGSMQNIMLELSKNGISIEEKVFPAIKPHKHGTCSFVNLKSALIGIIYLERKKELEKIGGIEKKEIEAKADEYSEAQYKKFTKDMRDKFVEKLIKKFHGAENANEKDLYLQIMTRILMEHSGEPKAGKSEKKMSHEIERAQKILGALDNNSKEKIATNMIEAKDSLTSFLRLYEPLKIPSFSKLLWDFVVSDPDKVQEAFWKALKGKDAHGLKLLLENKETRDLIDVNKKHNDQRYPPFVYAAAFLGLDIVKILAEYPNLDPYVCQKESATVRYAETYSALTLTTLWEHKDVVKFLVETLKVDPRIPDGSDRKALEIAKVSKDEKMISLLQPHVDEKEKKSESSVGLTFSWENKSSEGREGEVKKEVKKDKKDQDIKPPSSTHP